MLFEGIQKLQKQYLINTTFLIRLSDSYTFVKFINSLTERIVVSANVREEEKKLDDDVKEESSMIRQSSFPTECSDHPS